MGFGIPIDILLNQLLKEKLRYFSSNDFIKSQNLFQKSKVNSFFEEYSKRVQIFITEMWNFFIFQSWFSKWMN